MKGFVDEQGQAYFKVAPGSGLVWLSRREGMDLGSSSYWRTSTSAA
jgi:hypothetical protein